MVGILESFLRNNWHIISSGGGKPPRLNILKLSGQPSDYASLNFLIFRQGDNEPAYFIKMNRKPSNFEPIEKEYENIKYFRNIFHSSRISGTFPSPMFLRMPDIQSVIMVEDFLPGRKCDMSGMRGRVDLFFHAFSWLKVFHASTKTGEDIFSWGVYREKLTDGLRKISSNKDILRLSESVLELAKRHDGCAIPITALQGNFDFDNILISGEKVYVLDWEDSRKQAPPFLDLEFLLFHTAMYSHGRRKHIENFKSFFSQSSESYRMVNRFLDDYCSFLGVRKEVFYLESLLDCLNIANNGYGVHNKVPTQDDDFIEVLLDLVLREVT